MDRDKTRQHTVHCFSIQVVPAVIPVDFELEFLLRIGDLPDLVSVIDEVAAL